MCYGIFMDVMLKQDVILLIKLKQSRIDYALYYFNCHTIESLIKSKGVRSINQTPLLSIFLNLPYDPHASQFSGLSSEQLMSLWFCSTSASGSRVSAACFSTGLGSLLRQFARLAQMVKKCLFCHPFPNAPLAYFGHGFAGHGEISWVRCRINRSLFR